MQFSFALNASFSFSFVQLAKKYHPDTNPNDPEAKEKFAKLAEAYEVKNKKKQNSKQNSYINTNIQRKFIPEAHLA